jgi:hypothetical protein
MLVLIRWALPISPTIQFRQVDRPVNNECRHPNQFLCDTERPRLSTAALNGRERVSSIS